MFACGLLFGLRNSANLPIDFVYMIILSIGSTPAGEATAPPEEDEGMM